jgi:ATP-binding cassette subfamily C protein
MTAGTEFGSGQLPVADRVAVRRAVWRLIRADGRAMLGVLLLSSVAVATGLAPPALLGQIVNRVKAGEGASAVDSLALAIVGFAFLQVILVRFARYSAHRFAERALVRLRTSFVDHVLALPTAVVERAGTGDLMTRSAGDVNTVGFTIGYAAPDVFIAALQVGFILTAVFVLSPLLGLCGLIGLPMIWLIARWYLRRARTAYLAEGSARSSLSDDLAGTVAGARTVEALRLQRRRIDSGDRRIAYGYGTQVRTLFLRNVLYPAVDFSYSLPLAAMLLVGGICYVHGIVSLGAVIAASLYMRQLVEPLDIALQWMEQLQQSGASLARVEGVGQVADTAPPRGGEPVDDRLVAHDVHYTYDGAHEVLRGIDLAIRPGERLAIVGRSGAGKSTFGRLLAGIDSPGSGTVTLGGVPIGDLPPDVLRRRVVLVTQEHHVFLGSLRDNLAIAAPTASDDALLAALSTVDAQWVMDLPDGLDTELGSAAYPVDAAAAQQLALARVVLADPHTLILDEATAMLDPTTARQAERSLAAVLRGRTVIAIAHRLQTAHDADRVAVIDDGTITELGSHRELVAASGAYAALWRTWHGGPDLTAE